MTLINKDRFSTRAFNRLTNGRRWEYVYDGGNCDIKREEYGVRFTDKVEIKTIEELAQCQPCDLLSVWGFGRKTLIECLDILKTEHGYTGGSSRLIREAEEAIDAMHEHRFLFPH